MNRQEALSNLKKLCDVAIKAGLFPSLEDANVFYRTFEYIKNNLGEPNSDNNKQQKQDNNHKESRTEFEVADLP